MVKRSRIAAFFLLVIVLFGVMGTTASGIMKNIKLGLDLQGGFEVLYEVKPEKGEKVTKEMLNSTVAALDRRVNVLGVNEPIIQIEGNDRIRVQLAGVEDQNNARRILSTSAKISFRDYNDKEMMTGKDLKEGGAKQSFDSKTNQPVVEVTLKDAKKFKKVTQEISQKPLGQNVLAIWLDFKEGKDTYKDPAKHENLVSDPRVSQVFNQNNVMITGSFTIKEAQELANMLNAGALPVDLKEIYSTSVGAKFGEEALNQTIFAGIIGVAVIYLFMWFFYRLPGFIATVSLTIYIFLILLVFDWMNAVLTLPGIAALILGVGMAVDANIITFERIKDEIRVGRSIKSAYHTGNKHSLATVLDANITTLLAAAVLFYFGTSSVRGFATMLIISIFMGMLTNVFGTRLFLNLWVNSGFLNKRAGWFNVKSKQIHKLKDFNDTLHLPTPFDKLDFVKKRKLFYTLSIAVTVIGIIFLFVFKLNLGIDFTSGTRVQVTSDKPVTAEAIKDDFKTLGLTADDVVLSGENNKNAVARMVGVMDKGEISKAKEYFNKKYGHEPNVSTVSPTVGKELAKNAFYSVLIASIGIIIYVSIRFEWRMALPAVVALLHDAFFIITVFSVFRFEVDLTFIAAVLTIIGYSINDTIVTFDRIRENMKKKTRIKHISELEEIVNISIRQTLVRSLNTVLTVLVTVIALVLFGSESIRTFSIALFIGLIIGVYSSIFIASQFWLDLKEKELKKKGSLKTQKEKKKSTDEALV
ncbi:protein translocase subunit SecDF [Bacillus sp. 1P06AnD]|uniref:protein translocase subunit SecDF n=1 Tax=Bacillus sp. 1P06AnD TaxID=3132208 RepID=UPI00399FC3AE